MPRGGGPGLIVLGPIRKIGRDEKGGGKTGESMKKGGKPAWAGEDKVVSAGL